MKTNRASPKQKILLRGLWFFNEWILSRIVSFVETEHAALLSSSVGNISIHVTDQNYIQVKIVQRRLDPYFLCFLALIIHWIRAGYKENWDLTKLIGQIKIPGGGGYSLKPYGYVPSHRVRFLRHFGLKTGIHFAHFGLESGVVFEGTAAAYERIYRFNSKWVRKKEK